MHKNTSEDNVFLSVCIPSYNRPKYLRDLLVTIAQQDYENYEVVVCDDNSPLTNAIEEVVLDMTKQFPDKTFRFIRNPKTLGYDGNFRGLITLAHGDYCVYMGDDDLLCPGALSRIASVVKGNPNIGVIIRSYAIAERETKIVREEFRYFDSDRIFEPGRQAVTTLFRRSVAIAGYTVNRKMAADVATDKFDGTLLYQLYLTGMIAYKNGGYYIFDCIAVMRKDSEQKPTHFFGTAEAEKSRFKPGKLSTNNSLNFVRGFFEIAQYLKVQHDDKALYSDIVSDIGNYAYPLLSVQRDKSIREFIRYFNVLRASGLKGNYYFYFYFLVLLLLGRKVSGKLIVAIKNIFGKTPELGQLYRGNAITINKGKL